MFVEHGSMQYAMFSWIFRVLHADAAAVAMLSFSPDVFAYHSMLRQCFVYPHTLDAKAHCHAFILFTACMILMNH